MEDQRLGRIVRALRRRRGWRQTDLAIVAGCAQTSVSLIERGHLAHISLPALRHVIAALEATLDLEIRWQGAALDRLLDEDHARLVAKVVELLTRLGWETRVEVTYSEYGERGSYDVLAWHAATRTVLVIEVKTDLPSAEATVRKLDEKTRLARKVAREGLDWRAASVSRVLVMPDESTLRRIVGRHGVYFDRVLPVRGAEVRSWLREPEGQIAALWFLSGSNEAARIHRRGGRHRVRVPKSGPESDATAA